MWCLIFGHSFKEVARRFTNPTRKENEFDFIYDYKEVASRKSIYGFTTIEKCCQNCNCVRFTEVIGNQTTNV